MISRERGKVVTKESTFEAEGEWSGLTDTSKESGADLDGMVKSLAKEVA